MHAAIIHDDQTHVRYFAVTGAVRIVDEIARRHGGAVDKFLSDCLLAMFGGTVRRDRPWGRIVAHTAALERATLTATIAPAPPDPSTRRSTRSATLHGACRVAQH